MQLIELIAFLISGAITFANFLGSLLNKQRPFLHAGSLAGPIQFEEPKSQITKDDSMFDFQFEIEKLFNKNQLIPRIRNEFFFSKDPDFLQLISNSGLHEDFALNLLVQMVLHKRAKLSVLVGCLRKHFIDHGPQASQMTADALLMAAHHDLVNYSTATQEFIVKYGISPDVQAEIDRYQYPLPMVIEPEELKTNRDTGYLTIRNSAILRDNHHDDDICLDHLNRMNRIKLKINQDVALTVKNSWKNLDKPKPDEEIEEYKKRVKAFEKYNKTAHDVIHHLGLATGGEFYLTHKYDKRGRTYSQGYVVNYQGTPWNKAVIEFAEGEVVQ